VAGQIAFWTRDIRAFFTQHEIAMAAARTAGDQALEIIDLSAAVFVRAAVTDVDEACAALSELNTIAGVVRQPSLIGYTHFAAGALRASTTPIALWLNCAQRWNGCASAAMSSARSGSTG